MTLYLHCGYHKTASSYLQSCFASKKALLAKHGMFYPDSARGIPTAGNGAELAQALLALNSRRALEMLKDYARHARCMGLGAVLLSTEGFFSSFAREESLAMFANLALQSGFQNVNAILFFVILWNTPFRFIATVPLLVKFRVLKNGLKHVLKLLP
jgi:hypothetical protein